MIKAAEIVDHSIELALKESWESFSLVELASELDCSLNDIRHYFRSKDDIAEAIFDRADAAMLALPQEETYQQLSENEKLITAIMCWFEFLAPIKPLVKEIMAYKFEPGHFHLQAHGITRVSRTVQWFMTVAQRNSRGVTRLTDEVAVTSAYLSCFAFFLIDQSPNDHNTRAMLSRLIKQIDHGQHLLARLLPSRKRRPGV